MVPGGAGSWEDWREAGVGDSSESWGQGFGTSFGFSKGTYCVRISGWEGGLPLRDGTVGGRRECTVLPQASLVGLEWHLGKNKYLSERIELRIWKCSLCTPNSQDVQLLITYISMNG